MKSILHEDFDYKGLLEHIKHIEEYKDDPRCKKEAVDLLKSIKNFGHKYNMIADQLAMSPAGKALSSDNIVGYMKDKRTACKYNKDTHDFVAYKYKSPRYKTMTLHKKTHEQYLKICKRDFYSELPENIEDEERK